MHPLLHRQLRRLGLGVQDAPDGWAELLESVARTYAAADQDRYTLERSLMISSRELQELYESLRCSSEKALDSKHAELEKSLALARAIQEAVLDGILVEDEDHAMTGHNRRLVEMWDIPAEALADPERRVSLMAARVADPGAFRRRIVEIGGRRSESASDEIRLEDGRVFERYSGPVPSEQGARHGRIWCFRDVTERRKLEVDRLVVSERMVSMGRLAASVAHEINNPLAYVIANLEYLTGALPPPAEGPPASGAPTPEEAPEDPREVCVGMRRGLDRIRLVVRDLQMLSRGDEERRAAVDVRSVLDTSVQMVSNQIRHRARLSRQYQPTAPVRVNEGRLGQVFLNLLVNAVQALPEGRVAENTITVTTEERQGRVRVEVRDTGQGIPPEHLDRIFDPFFTTKAIGTGTGLGLSICKEIVEAQGGTLTVTSVLGVGSAFVVELPMACASQSLAAVRAKASVPPAGRRHVLIIDDEPDIRRSLERLLRRDHQVTSCAGAREAMARLDAGERFDVILCDLMMPEVTGMDLHAEIVEKHPSCAHRIVFLTGGAFTPRSRAFLDSVDNLRLEKPFDLGALRRAIGNMAA